MSGSRRLKRVSLSQVAVVAGCVGLALFSFSATAAEVFAKRLPNLAVQLFPGNADAMSQLAMVMIRNGERKNPEVARLVSESLNRKPANAAALRVLALTTNDTSHAAALFALSERMSRRDSMAQLALIEIKAAAGDNVNVLRHYDRLMRVKPEMSNTLMPILVPASADPVVRREVARYLRDRPIWWGNYIATLARSGNSPAALESAVRALRLKLDVASESSALSAVLFRLAALGAWPEMSRVSTAYCTKSCGSLIRNGDFEHEPTLMPLDWILSSDPTASAVVPTADGRGSALEMQGHGIDQGARQMLLLSPGSYILSVRVDGPSPRMAPTVEVKCAQGLGIVSATTAVGQLFRLRFMVPSSCAAQWLSFRSSDADQNPDNPVHIDDVDIRRLPLSTS